MGKRTAIYDADDKSRGMTLGELRAVLADHENTPGDTTVRVAVNMRSGIKEIRIERGSDD